MVIRRLILSDYKRSGIYKPRVSFIICNFWINMIYVKFFFTSFITHLHIFTRTGTAYLTTHARMHNFRIWNSSMHLTWKWQKNVQFGGKINFPKQVTTIIKLGTFWLENRIYTYCAIEIDTKFWWPTSRRIEITIIETGIIVTGFQGPFITPVRITKELIIDIYV